MFLSELLPKFFILPNRSKIVSRQNYAIFRFYSLRKVYFNAIHKGKEKHKRPLTLLFELTYGFYMAIGDSVFFIKIDNGNSVFFFYWIIIKHCKTKILNIVAKCRSGTYSIQMPILGWSVEYSKLDKFIE